MKSKYCVATIVIVLVVLSIPVLCEADTYLITGQMGAIGNPVCGLSPCVQTISYSFQLSPTLNLLEPGSPYTYLTDGYSHGQFSGSGVFNSFTGIHAAWNPVGGPSGWGGIYLFNGLGDEVDFEYSIGPGTNGWDIQVFDGYFYRCVSATCIADFGGEYRYFRQFSVSVTQIPEQVPEPTSLVLLGACGFLPLLHRKRNSRDASASSR